MVSLEHTRGFYGGVFRVGGANTYIIVDATNKSIKFYVDGVLVDSWL